MDDSTNVTPPESSNVSAASTALPVTAEPQACCGQEPVTTGPLPVVSSGCCSTPTETTKTSCSSSPDAASEGDATPELTDEQLIEALREVIDPELMVNIVDLGLVYAVSHNEAKVDVEMTLTSPACPAGPQIIHQSKMALERLEGVDEAVITLVMSPPWTPDRMTDEARDQLGIF